MKVLMIGCAVLGQQTLDILLDQNAHEITGVLDENPNVGATLAVAYFAMRSSI